MRVLSTALVESIVQSGSMMAARLSLIAATFVIGYFQPLIEVTQFDLFAIAATFVALGLGLGMDSGLSLIATEKKPSERNLMLWVALGFPACAVSVLGLILWLAHFWLEPIFLTWEQWALAITLGYFQANLTIAYSFDRFCGSAIKISLKILFFNLLGFAGGSILLAQGGQAIDFMITFTIALGLGNLWVIPGHLRRNTVPRQERLKATNTFKNLIGFSVWYLMSSLTLLMRRPIERFAILSVSSPEMLGGYIIISRLAELVGLVGTVLSAGFMPIILRRFDDAEDVGKALARNLLNGYFALSVLLLSGGLLMWPLYLEQIPFPAEFPTMPVMFVLIAANIFIGAASLSGQGFILSRKGHWVGIAGLILMTTFAAFTIFFLLLGIKIWSAPLGLLSASAIYILLVVQGSERIAPINYTTLRQIGWMTALVAVAFVLGQYSS
ncbi:hypothetical protein WG622_17455 [Cognatishimia sp. D5M38]|uniref:Membrane protein involved in the export of O-antigen and teichoic acid n=1 Tax=Cognatishimia coralii TaxID=3083254 RepID=A0ABU8QKU8_9RHOB